MLTIFSTTRAFNGLFATIQWNALRSWTLLEPRPEIIIFGDDPGTKEICADLDLVHVPDVETSELGTPLVSDMFEQAQRLATYDTCCFINSDIMLFPDFLDAVEKARSTNGPFMMVGQRWDLDITRRLEFGAGWQERLQQEARTSGRLRSEILIDYFVFPRGMFGEIPPFAIGRSAYDNWLIWKAGDLGAAVIDATARVTIVHQNHDYSHAGGMKAVWEGPEAQRAHQMIGHWSRYHAVAHARFMFGDDGRIVPARGRKYRLARPRRVASHLLRFTRPMRRRLENARIVGRQRVREGADIPAPAIVNREVNRIAERLAPPPPPLREVPGHRDGDTVVPTGRRVRFGLWLVGRFVVFEHPMTLLWHRGQRLSSWLGDDVNRGLFVEGAYEPNELAFLAGVLRPDSTIIDVGAGQGLSAVLASSVVHAGSVVAIEPSGREADRLRRNLALNDARDVVVVEQALGEKPGTATMHVADPRHAGQNTVGEADAAGSTAGEPGVAVTLTSLDCLVQELGLARVDVMKVDVGGGEAAVVQGAGDVLRDRRPIVLLAVRESSLQAHGSSTAELVDLVTGHDLVLAPFSDVTGRPTIGLPPSAGALNLVAVPSEKVGALVDAGVIDRAAPGAVDRGDTVRAGRQA
jgi:FkbM family methyltransferase